MDVNVRRPTGKTPLLEAVENDVWGGYVTVIFFIVGCWRES